MRSQNVAKSFKVSQNLFTSIQICNTLYFSYEGNYIIYIISFIITTVRRFHNGPKQHTDAKTDIVFRIRNEREKGRFEALPHDNDIIVDDGF